MIEIKFTYNSSEYTSAVRFFLFKQWTTFRSLAMWVTFLVILSWLLRDDSHSIIFNFISTSTVFISIIILVMFFLQPFFMIKRNPNFKNEYTVQFDDTGINLHTKNIDSKLGWDLFNRFLENKMSYLLCAKSTIIVIPKSAFLTEDSRKQAMILFEQKVKSK